PGIRIVDVQAVAAVVHDYQIEDPPQVRVRVGRPDAHADAALIHDRDVLEHDPSRLDDDAGATVAGVPVELEVAQDAGIRLHADAVEVAVLQEYRRRAGCGGGIHREARARQDDLLRQTDRCRDAVHAWRQLQDAARRGHGGQGGVDRRGVVGGAVALRTVGSGVHGLRPGGAGAEGVRDGAPAAGRGDGRRLR